jgi:hypothetical protein
MPIKVSVVSGNLQWSEETRTLVVNAHGALILPSNAVEIGQQLTLSDLRTDLQRQVPGGDDRQSSGKSERSGSRITGRIRFLAPGNPPNDWAQFRNRRGARRSKTKLKA